MDPADQLLINCLWTSAALCALLVWPEQIALLPDWAWMRWRLWRLNCQSRRLAWKAWRQLPEPRPPFEKYWKPVQERDDWGR